MIFDGLWADSTRWEMSATLRGRKYRATHLGNKTIHGAVKYVLTSNNGLARLCILSSQQGQTGPRSLDRFESNVLIQLAKHSDTRSQQIALTG